MPVLLLSTYDLGRQPFGLASPLAWLRRAGIDASARDLSRERVSDAQLASASLVGVYLPMHTATRLALPLLDRIAQVAPGVPVCAFGLYAPLNAALLHEHGVRHLLGPEFEADLVALAVSLAADVAPLTAGDPDLSAGALSVSAPRATARPRRTSRSGGGAEVEGSLLHHAGRDDPSRSPRSPARSSFGQLPRLHFLQPDRQTLLAPSRYAQLVLPDGTRRVAGSTESTRGCKHRCRHCPVVAVYDGRFRVVPVDVVLADIHAQVNSGAEHITFGDPDFLNGPAHARRVVERLHNELPAVTYDVTVKVEHLRAHPELLPVLARTGCLFVTSAFESVDDGVLTRLEKGHTRADLFEVVERCRDSGLTLAPTFVAFTPWTMRSGYRDLLDTVEVLGLVDNVAPVQWGLRLLVTNGSRLLELPDLQALIGSFNARSLTHPWTHPDPSMDDLQRDVANLTGGAGQRSRRDVFDAVRALAAGATTASMLDTPVLAARATVPYLDEPWYC